MFEDLRPNTKVQNLKTTVKKEDYIIWKALLKTFNSELQCKSEDIFTAIMKASIDSLDVRKKEVYLKNYNEIKSSKSNNSKKEKKQKNSLEKN